MELVFQAIDERAQAAGEELEARVGTDADAQALDGLPHGLGVISDLDRLLGHGLHALLHLVDSLLLVDHLGARGELLRELRQFALHLERHAFLLRAPRRFGDKGGGALSDHVGEEHRSQRQDDAEVDQELGGCRQGWLVGSRGHWGGRWR